MEKNEGVWCFKRKIICWGTGQQFDLISSSLKQFKLEKQIEYVIDSDNKKVGNEVWINEKSYIVRTKEILKEFDPKEYFLFISTIRYYGEVYAEIIAEYPEWKEQVFPMDYLWELNTDEKIQNVNKCPANYRKNEHETIPSVIHTFWFSKDKIPEEYQRCMESWRMFCPNYKIKVWTLDNYNDNGCIFFREAINAKKWAFASDYSRAEIIYKYGGIYMDMDVEMVRNIDDLLYNDAYMSFQDLSYIECGSGFGAVKGNSIIGEIVNEYEKIHFLNDAGEEDLTTCPQRYTEVLERHGLIKNGGFQDVSGMTIYPFEYLTAKSFGTGITYKSEYTYTIHHHNGSWVSKENKDKWNQKYKWIKQNLYRGVV